MVARRQWEGGRWKRNTRNSNDKNRAQAWADSELAEIQKVDCVAVVGVVPRPLVQ